MPTPLQIEAAKTLKDYEDTEWWFTLFFGGGCIFLDAFIAGGSLNLVTLVKLNEVVCGNSYKEALAKVIRGESFELPEPPDCTTGCAS